MTPSFSYHRTIEADLKIVTFGYTTAFWQWEEWELQLDWMALHGINLPLAWVGFEKTLSEVFQEIGLTNQEISTFLSGPAFLPWNRFGNIQGSWGGGDLPDTWMTDQRALQKKIVARMAELGMTPVLPAFPGFVPRAITRVLPNASVVNSDDWAGFPKQYSYDTFLEPFDEHYPQLQKSFLLKQQAALGNVTHVYTLDQYNEINPYSGNTTYLHDIAASTIQSLKGADPNAIWLMQGWLFYSSSSFWTSDRVQAYLSGVQNTDMVILDLFSESAPQWQRTQSYYGKPWIWCTLHDFGGNMNYYGQIMNLTQDPIEALADSDSLVGFGLTMEGQEGNEIIYQLLLDQAWSETPIDTESYFHDWVTARYAGSASALPQGLYDGWQILRTTAYNNTNFGLASSVPKAALVRQPGTGLVNPAHIMPYNTSAIVQAWKNIYDSAIKQPALWQNPSYQFDVVDITRQVMTDAFAETYLELMGAYQNSASNSSEVSAIGAKLVSQLNDLDSVLATNGNFLLDKWLTDARSWAKAGNAAYYEYNARNQLTLWGPDGEITDYASKQWAGLVSSYYVPRWKMYVDYISSTPAAQYNYTAFHDNLMEFELQWQTQSGNPATAQVTSCQNAKSQQHQQCVLKYVVKKWPDVFSG